MTAPSGGLDFDGGGLKTGIEWVVGGDPTDPSDDASVAPTWDNASNPDYAIFTYTRADVANDDTNTTIAVEYGSELSGWTSAADDGDNVIITVTPGSPADTVEVKFKRSSIAAGGRLFARLKVVTTP